MEKFFNKSFGVCKFVSFGVMILMVVSMALSILCAIYSFRPVPMKVPTFGEVQKQVRVEKREELKNESKVPAYQKYFDEICIDCNLTSYGRTWFWNNYVSSVTDKEMYLKGLRKYLKDAARANKVKYLENFDDIEEAMDDYDSYYTENWNKKIDTEVTLDTVRIVSFSTLGGAFLLFFVFILYPLLLRIEVNTRKEEPQSPEIQVAKEPQE